MINLLIVFYPIIRDIFKFLVDKSNISIENKKALYAAIDACDYERSMPSKLRESAKRQMERLNEKETVKPIPPGEV